ncbi:hypothetical protein HDR63_01750 [bacterium]|nr:hypothetical protein [bacterium]
MKNMIKSMSVAAGCMFLIAGNAWAIRPQTQVYQWAKQNDTASLTAHTDILNSTNAQGNTALCQAILDDDVAAYNVLKNAGANTEPKCLAGIDPEKFQDFINRAARASRWTFMGLDKWGWGLIGAGLVVGGGTAAAMASGGGSGGGDGADTNAPLPPAGNNPDDNKNDNNQTNNNNPDDKPTVLNCVHGTQNGNACVCHTGYTGTLCDKLKDNFIEQGGNVYEKLNCVHGTQNANVCVCDTGYTGKLCDTPDSGTGYPKLNCVNGVQQDDKCVCWIGYDGTLCDHCINMGTDGKCIIIGKDNPEPQAANQGNTITITNKSDAVIYGFFSPHYEAYNNGIIVITNESDSDVYGMYVDEISANAYSDTSSNTGVIDISSKGSGNIYGLYIFAGANALVLNENSTGASTGIIRIKSETDKGTYGIYAESVLLNAASELNSTATGIIDITSAGTGNVYGLYSSGDLAYNVDGVRGRGIIRINHNSSGNVYGLYSKKNDASGTPRWHNNDAHPNLESIISIMNNSSGKAYAIYSGESSYNDSGDGFESIINMANIGSGRAVGMYGTKEISNSGTINIHNLGDGVAVGIYADGANVTNSGAITIDRTPFTDDNLTDDTSDDVTYTAKSERGGTAIGIYATSGAIVNNSGTITINGADTAYGIYAENGATVTNTGTISIDGVSCDGATCSGSQTYGNHIVLNGASLINAGTMSAGTLNLDDMGGNIVATQGAKFVAENDISGTLNISSDIVSDGFDTTYIAENMIDAGDVSGLRLKSGSAMFDAKLADNGNDVVMTMKSFDALTDNKSLATYLANNYARGAGAEFFGGLKAGATRAEFNTILNGLSGMNAFTQFDREDMSAMREINFSMNQQMFMNADRDEYDISGSMEHFSFSNSSNGGSGSYGISNSRMSDKWKLGYGLAMANIGTNDDLGTNRSNQIGLFYMPVTYTNDAVEFISTPRVGFAKSHYSRRGYNNLNYDGYIEKQIFGFNNDLRYPVSFGHWTVAPDLGFNAMMYRQSGHESDQAFSLIIPADEIYTVEAGLGLFTKYERPLTSGASLRFNAGLMAYRELADTYNMKLGIRGLDGTFNLYDDAAHDYSGAATFGLDYQAGRLSLYGNAQYFVDGDAYMNVKGGIRYRF